MGRRFGGQERSGMGGASRPMSLAGVAACLCVAAAIAGCGGGSSSGSASVAATTTAATTATGPTTPTTTSTAAKPPKSHESSTTTTKSTTTPSKPPAAKSSTKSSESAAQEKTFGKIKITSTAFKTGGPIAVKYTCDGADTSPPLQWHGVPRGAAEVFMLAIDLSGTSSDAVQWAVAGIPPSTTRIAAGSLPAGAVTGVNSAGKVGWDGICGSKGQLHHVGFLFYALKRKLNLKAGFNPVEVRDGLKNTTLATGLTLATYQRP